MRLLIREIVLSSSKAATPSAITVSPPNSVPWLSGSCGPQLYCSSSPPCVTSGAELLSGKTAATVAGNKDGEASSLLSARPA